MTPDTGSPASRQWYLSAGIETPSGVRFSADAWLPESVPSHIAIEAASLVESVVAQAAAEWQRVHRAETESGRAS